MTADVTPIDIPTMIVDDQDDIRQLLRILIQRENHGLAVVAEAGDGPQAIALVDDADPRVIVLDHMMPDLNGIDTAVQIRAKRPGQVIILFSAYLDDGLIESAADAGIDLCVEKGDIERVPSIIRELMAS